MGTRANNRRTRVIHKNNCKVEVVEAKDNQEPDNPGITHPQWTFKGEGCKYYGLYWYSENTGNRNEFIWSTEITRTTEKRKNNKRINPSQEQRDQLEAKRTWSLEWKHHDDGVQSTSDESESRRSRGCRRRAGSMGRLKSGRIKKIRKQKETNNPKIQPKWTRPPKKPHRKRDRHNWHQWIRNRRNKKLSCRTRTFHAKNKSRDTNYREQKERPSLKEKRRGKRKKTWREGEHVTSILTENGRWGERDKVVLIFCTTMVRNTFELFWRW